MQEHNSELFKQGSTTRRNFLTVDNVIEERNLTSGPNSPRTYLDQRKPNIYDLKSISEGNLGTYRGSTSRNKIEDADLRSNSQGQVSERRVENQLDEEQEDSSSEDYSDENQNEQNGEKPQVERRNGLMVEKKKSKFNDLIFQLRMKNKVRRLANSLNSRMYKNLTGLQYKMIGDKSIDNTIVSKHFLQQDQSNAAHTTNADPEHSGRKKSYFDKFWKQLDTILPVFNPRSNLKVYLEMLSLISIILIFYSFCIIISFKMNIDSLLPHTVLEIALGCLFVNSFVNLNTGFYEDMKLSKDRQQMFTIYYKTHFYVDIFSFISVLTFLIFDKTQFLDSNSAELQASDGIEVTDLGTLLRFLVFIPFIFKLRDFSKFMIALEEKVIFQKQEQNIIQLVKLFSSVILIDHFMACLWVTVAKISFNIDSNWETRRGCQQDSWFRQYTLAFYYSTVTMTTVGYGDIVPTNQTETLVSIFMMLFSSGVFGFTLNQIGIIFTELYAEVKETRRKMKIINIHMEKRNVKHPLRMQIRAYLDYVWKENNEQFQNESAAIIDQLNDSLKKELQLHQNEKIIEYLKKHYSEAFIQKAFSLIQEVQCKPQQLIYKGGQQDNMSLYLIEKGKVEVFYKTKAIRNTTSQNYFIHEIQEGQLFGIGQFYTGIPRDLNVRAVGFVSLLRISREEFIQLLEQFPDDKEAFCFIRDSLTLYQDGRKSSSACPSCGSFNHHLLECNYLHYVPDQEKVCKRYDYTPKDCATLERRKYVQIQKKNNNQVLEGSDDGDSLRTRGKFKTRYDLPFVVEQLYFDQLEVIEEYDCKYLRFNLNRMYMASQKDQLEEEENKEKDEQLEETQQQSIFKPDEASINQQTIVMNKQSSLDQSAQVQFEQSSELEKQMTGNLDRQGSLSEYSPLQKRNSLSPKRQPIREREQSFDIKMKNQGNQQGIFKGHRKTLLNSNQHPINSPQNRNQIRPKSIIIVDAYDKQYTPSDFSKYSTEQKLSQDITSNNHQIGIQPFTSSSNTALNTNGMSKPNIFKQPIDEIALMPTLQLSKIVSADHANTLLYSPNVVHTIPSSNNIQNQQSSVRNSDRHNTSLKRVLSMKMKHFQTNIMKNIQDLMKQSNEKNEDVKKLEIIDETDEQYGMQQIFRNFDKQKNFYIYFPFNNLNYLLMKLETKVKVNRSFYLDILMQKKKSPHQANSSHTMFRSKYEKLKIKTDRLQNKNSRGGSSVYGTNKNKTIQDEHAGEIVSAVNSNANIHKQRRSAFFEKFQIESPFEQGTERGIASARSINNNKISFNNFFSKYDISQQDIQIDSNPQIFSQPELSPNVADCDSDTHTPDFQQIHYAQFKAKNNAFNPIQFMISNED